MLLAETKYVFHDAQDLVELFNNLFQQSHRTILVRGDAEPLYIPAKEAGAHHQLIFAHGFFASALHEIAHWCIAGSKRRQCIDFGYWYQPDGRTLLQQKAFESAEVKPQALEWIFSVASQHSFRFSADNLNGAAGSSASFKDAVWHQALAYLSGSMPRRALHFCQALCCRYQTQFPLNVNFFPRPRDE